jgi:NADPH-dependent 2,4-dienoyl-CoA reductase/sulfur reductase-like enzyme/rhodanese-related sulfurtransferase
MPESVLTIVVVGGVAGGASAATRARRVNESAEIILFEKDEYVSFANCGLPYYVGGEITDRSKLLVVSADLLARRFQLDVRIRQEVQSIDRAAKTVRVLNRTTGTTYTQPYDRLILAPGAAPLVPPIEGADADGVFTLRNVADVDRIKAAADASTTKKAIVVGAGYIGIEMVEQLVRCGFQTTLAEMKEQVLPLFDPEMVRPLQDELTAHNVALHLGDGIAKVTTDSSGRATGIDLASGTHVKGDLVILGIGVRPNLQLAREAGLAIGPGGGIATNRFMQTDDPNIYAVGDAAEYVYGPTGKPLRIALAGPANRAGRLAGEHAATGKANPMADVLGTSIVRLFEGVAAMTGLTSGLAKAVGQAARSVTVVANNHAGYYPGATPLTLKLLYEPETGHILGAQAVGQEGVDKRIDVIATAMALHATVRDLAGLDLAYAPPFGAAKDPVHMAAFVACNQLDGLDDVVDADVDLTGKQVVDVRTAAEIAEAPLAGAPGVIAIPVDDLRGRIDELDKTADTVVTCKAGLRGHIALRVLRQHGFEKVANLSGGSTVRNRALAD